MAKFSKNDRVILSANEEYGWEEERGTVLDISGIATKIEGKQVWMVQLDDIYWQSPLDDGLRECDEDQMTLEP